MSTVFPAINTTRSSGKHAKVASTVGIGDTNAEHGTPKDASDDKCK